MKKITKTKNVQRIEKPEKRVVKIVKLPNKGDSGYTPEKGKDYNDGYTPIKGTDYFDGKDAPQLEEIIDSIIPLIPKPIKWEKGDSIKWEPWKNITKKQARAIVDEAIAEKMPELMSSLEWNGNVGIEQDSTGTTFTIKGKKYKIQSAVYWPKLRDIQQMGDFFPWHNLRWQAGKSIVVATNEAGFELATSGGGAVVWVTGLNTDNTDPTNPIVKISVDGVTVTGLGTPWSPLVALWDGTGDVHWPVSATDNAIARYDLTTGKIIQNSGITIADGASGTLSGTNSGDNATNTQYSGLATSKQDALSLTTTGSSGAATLVGATLNIPQYTGGSGTVTSVTSANSDATVATTTTTPVITIVSAPKLTTARTIGGTSFDGTANIAVALATTVTTNANLTWTVTSTGNATAIANGAISNAMLANSAVANLSGTNTGDNATNTQYSGLVSNATHTWDATGSTALTVVKINGTSLAGLATGILKNTTTTGVPSIAVAADFPTLNQNTSGYASALKSATTTIDVSAATAPTSGQVLTATASTTATWQTPSAPVSTKLTFSGNFETAARYTTTQTGTGTSVTYDATGASLTTSNSTQGSIKITYWPPSNNGVLLFANSPTFTTYISLGNLWFPSATTTGSVYAGVGDITVWDTSHTFTNRHIGWKVLYASGAHRLYATQADWTTENVSSSLTTIGSDDILELIAIVNGTTSVDYYWRKNGGSLSSVTTLTGNVPTGSTNGNRIQWSCQNGADATRYGIVAANFSYTR